MAKLRQLEGSEVRVIQGDTLIGRSSACNLRLETTDVSKEHAALRWTGESWDIRDLNSRNGTFVNGRRLGPSDKVTLSVGTQLSFGASERWVCVDLAPPMLGAKTIDEGPTRHLSGQQLLAFDDGEKLGGTISRDVQGRWVLERDDEVQLVRTGEEIELCGRKWQLTLPEHSTTTDISSGVLSVLDMRLRFVTPANQAIQVYATVAGEVLDLKRRGHHHLTLALARLRLADQAKGLDELEAGWINYRKLQDILDCTRNLVNVNVHRARKQLEELDFVDAACIVERRQGSGKMRIGVAKLEIEEPT